jgi:hypothetical protein
MNWWRTMHQIPRHSDLPTTWSMPSNNESVGGNTSNSKTSRLTRYVVNAIKDELARDNASNPKRSRLTGYIVNTPKDESVGRLY